MFKMLTVHPSIYFLYDYLIITEGAKFLQKKEKNNF